jgi:hypothetical protein
LPVFGLAGWLLGGGVVHLILRLADKQGSFDWILNVIGWRLLIVMPAVWLLDWMAIGLEVYGGGFTPAMHAAISIWEVALVEVGLSELKGINFWSGCPLGLSVKGGVYIPCDILTM